MKIQNRNMRNIAKQSQGENFKKRYLKPIEAGHADGSNNGEENLQLDKRQNVPEVILLSNTSCRAFYSTLDKGTDVPRVKYIVCEREMNF